MDLLFWAGQILSLLSNAILLVVSILKVKRKVLLLANVVINLLLAASYFCLKGYSGAVCSLICVAVVAVFYFKEKIRKHIWIPILFSIAFIVFGIITWQNLASIIPVIGNIILVIAFWCDNEPTIKSLIAVVAALWIVYNIIIRSYFGIIGQSLSFLFNIICVFRYLKSRKTQ